MAKAEAGQQTFTSEADRRMSKKHLRDRIKIDNDLIAMDKQHKAEHQKLATAQRKQLAKVKRGK